MVAVFGVVRSYQAFVDNFRHESPLLKAIVDVRELPYPAIGVNDKNVVLH